MSGGGRGRWRELVARVKFLWGTPGLCSGANAQTFGAGSRLTVLGECPRDLQPGSGWGWLRARPGGCSGSSAPFSRNCAPANRSRSLEPGAGSLGWEVAGALLGFARGAVPPCSYEQYFGAGTRLTVIGEIRASSPPSNLSPLVPRGVWGGPELGDRRERERSGQLCSFTSGLLPSFPGGREAGCSGSRNLDLGLGRFLSFSEVFKDRLSDGGYS